MEKKIREKLIMCWIAREPREPENLPKPEGYFYIDDENEKEIKGFFHYGLDIDDEKETEFLTKKDDGHYWIKEHKESKENKIYFSFNEGRNWHLLKDINYGIKWLIFILKRSSK